MFPRRTGVKRVPFDATVFCATLASRRAFIGTMNPDYFATPAHAWRDARPRRGIAAAIGVSVLLHVLLLAYYHPQRAVLPPAPTPASAALTVWLRPPPPAPAPAPSQSVAMPRRPPVQKEASARAGKPRERVADQRTPAPAAPSQGGDSAVAAAPAPAAAPAAPADPFAPAPTPAKPVFDMEAARRIARKMANEKDPAKVGTALAQLPDPAIASESKLARDIAGAKRADCKDGIPGGLLAPLFLLMDKKDSGCKW